MMRNVLIWSVFAVSCVPVSQDARLSSYLQEHIGLAEQQFPKAIVVVSEDGCPHCDRAFADLARPRTSLRDCLFLVRIEGTTVDLHGFKAETQNVRFDDDRAFKKLGILQNSGLILMNGSRIDTVIPIELDGIERRFRYIETVLDSIAR